MSRRKDGKMELLRGVPLFANLDEGELEQVGRHADEVSVPSGQVLVTQDTAGNSFYVIIEGAADVYGQYVAAHIISPASTIHRPDVMPEVFHWNHSCHPSHIASTPHRPWQ